jgi:hypothetical protein
MSGFARSAIDCTDQRSVDMAEWTIETVADRFIEAAQTAHRLPPVRVQGYFTCWPAIKRMPWETLGAEPRVYRFPPDPAAIDRMLETMRWVQWLEEEQRHLVWMRAQRYPWKKICHRFGCDRTTAWRRWETALTTVAVRLNTGVAQFIIR